MSEEEGAEAGEQNGALVRNGALVERQDLEGWEWDAGDLGDMKEKVAPALVCYVSDLVPWWSTLLCYVSVVWYVSILACYAPILVCYVSSLLYHGARPIVARICPTNVYAELPFRSVGSALLSYPPALCGSDAGHR
eukprot:47251-Rhodomonas_salina.1